MTDNIIVLNSADAVNTFITNGNIAIGGEMSLAVGPWGRTAKVTTTTTITIAINTTTFHDRRRHHHHHL